MHHHSSFAEAAHGELSSIAVLQADGPQLDAPPTYDARSMHSDDHDLAGFGSPKPPRRRRTMRRLLAVVLLALVVGIIAGIVALLLTFDTAGDVPAGQTVAITIPEGADSQQIARILADEGVVGSRITFLARLRLNGDDRGFKAGTYQMKTGSTYDTVVKTLNEGPPPTPVFDVNIPEGLRIVDTARHIDGLRADDEKDGNPIPLPGFTGAQYQAAARAATVPARWQPPAGTKTVEGFLFPATYELRKKATAADMVSRQIEAFNTTMSDIDLSYARKRNLTPYEVVIIASMIEREARVAADRPMIAAVIYNRLRLRMTLGIDATIQYAVSGPDGWKVALTQSDLEIDSPFNTRTQMGLPPTPIASPGKASLEAAAKPADSDYLYYIADPEGSGKHRFHKTLDAFNADPWQP